MHISRFIACAIAACGAALAHAQQAPQRPPLETRVAWISQCPNEPKPPPQDDAKSLGVFGALISVVGPKLIGGAVDSAAQALKAAGSDRDTKTTARSGTDFYQVTKDGDVSPAIGCLLVVRGEFTTARSPFTWANNSDDLQGLQKPMFQLEARITPLKGGKFFQLVPKYLKVNDFEEFSFFDPKDRDYLVAIALKLPGAADAFGSAEFMFKGLQRGAELKTGDPRLHLATSRPVAFPAESADATKAKARLEGALAPFLLAVDILTPPQPTLTKVPSLQTGISATATLSTFCKALQAHNEGLPRQFAVNDERCAWVLEQPRESMEQALAAAHRSDARVRWARTLCTYAPARDKKAAACDNMDADPAVKKARDALANATFTYFTTDLTLTETREGSRLALWLGNALAASKDGVTEVLQERLVPKTQKQKDDEAAAERDARAAVLVADLEVTKAEEALSELLGRTDKAASDITAARIAVLKAKIAANKAHRLASLPAPYPEIDG